MPPRRNQLPRRNRFEIVYHFGKHGRWSMTSLQTQSLGADEMCLRLREAAEFIQKLTLADIAEGLEDAPDPR